MDLSLTLTPSTKNFFHITDLIYSEEAKPQKPAGSTPKPVPQPRFEMSHGDAAVFNKFSLKEPYLVNHEAKDPKGKRRLLDVLRDDRRAFYYFKQRHVFKRPEFQYKVKSALFKAKTPLEDGHGTKKVISHSPLPNLRVRSVSPMRHFPHTPTPGLLKPGPKDLNQSFNTLIAKCKGVKLNDEMRSRTDREQQQLKDFTRHMDWTKEVLDQVIGCEPDVLIPYYRSQREALDAFQGDVHQFAEEHRRTLRDPTKETARFAQLLRNNRNMLI